MQRKRPAFGPAPLVRVVETWCRGRRIKPPAVGQLLSLIRIAIAPDILNRDLPRLADDQACFARLLKRNPALVFDIVGLVRQHGQAKTDSAARTQQFFLHHNCLIERRRSGGGRTLATIDSLTDADQVHVGPGCFRFAHGVRLIRAPQDCEIAELLGVSSGLVKKVRQRLFPM